jgi:hypothetical protein
MIVERHREVVLYQDVQDFSDSVFAQQIPLVTEIQRQYSTVINLTLSPLTSTVINLPINLPYTIVNTVVYVQNLQVNRLYVDVSPTGLILFSIVSPIFYQLTGYTNVTVPVYGHEDVIVNPVIFTGTIIMSLANMSQSTVSIWITLEGLYSLYNLAQISPYIYKP